MSQDDIMFAYNLKRQLDQRDMKAADLAKAIGVSKSAISQWLKGVKIPRTDHVARICKLFNCELADLTNIPGGSDLTPAQREMIDLVPSLTPEELSVLASTAKALKAARRDTDR